MIYFLAEELGCVFEAGVVLDSGFECDDERLVVPEAVGLGGVESVPVGVAEGAGVLAEGAGVVDFVADGDEEPGGGFVGDVGDILFFSLAPGGFLGFFGGE